MDRNRPLTRDGGFTIVELVIAVLIGSVLTSVVIQSVGRPMARFSADGALRTFASYHARARAAAVETGQASALVVVSSGDSLVLIRDGVVEDGVNLRRRYNADVVTSGSSLVICMGPRGYTMTACNSFTSAETVRFVVGSDTAAVEVLPLGQLLYP